MGIYFTASRGQPHLQQRLYQQPKPSEICGHATEWSHGQRGNYWSDNSAFDLNGDGIADTAYRPNGIIDQIRWRAPVARLLLNSPAVRAL